MRKLGYIRVSSEGQNTARQKEQLQSLNLDQIYEEKISGATMDRKKLQKLLSELQPGDTIYVTDLTRITRSTKDLFYLIEEIKEKQALLVSLKDTWLDLSDENPYSEFLLTVMAGVNQLERDLIRMRQKAGRPTEKSFGNSQVLPKDYANKEQIKLVLKELSDQVASRLRMASCQTTCVSLFVGYSKGQIDKYGQTGWRRQMKVEPSNNTKVLTEHVLRLFEENYAPGVDVRNLGVSYGRLVWHKNLQLDLFSVPEEQIHETDMYFLIDKIHQKFGFKALIHASSLMEGATAISRASLVGGHAGGTVGLGTTK